MTRGIPSRVVMGERRKPKTETPEEMARELAEFRAWLRCAPKAAAILDDAVLRAMKPGKS